MPLGSPAWAIRAHCVAAMSPAAGCNRLRGACSGARCTDRASKTQRRHCVGSMWSSQSRWCWSSPLRSAGAQRWNSTASPTTRPVPDLGRFICTVTKRCQAGLESSPPRRPSCSTMPGNCFVPSRFPPLSIRSRQCWPATGRQAGNPFMAASNGGISVTETGRSCFLRRSEQFWSFWMSFHSGRPSTRPTC